MNRVDQTGMIMLKSYGITSKKVISFKLNFFIFIARHAVLVISCSYLVRIVCC